MEEEKEYDMKIEEAIKILIKLEKEENEEQRKRDLYRKLCEIDKMAERNINRMRGGRTDFDNNLYEV